MISPLIVWLMLRHPTWAWHLIWYSDYNPENSEKRHKDRIEEYKKHEFSLSEVLQKAAHTSFEQANSILHESEELKLGALSRDLIIPERFNASLELAQLCYSIVRLTKPSIIVETGVGRGVTSSYILAALEKNGKGHLYSIDLPVLRIGAKNDVGKLVPDHLRSRWTLIFGSGLRETRQLQRKLKSTDLFIHDSDHSYLNQLAEYRVALTFLKEGGLLVSDDVGNDALLEANEIIKGELMVTKQGKPEYLGFILK